MNLLELRTQFVKISGRYDLVVDQTDWADNGADFYIQAGQNFLDRLRDTPKSDNTIYTELAIGEWYVTFAKCRSIKEVWINNTEGRSQLEKKPMNWLYGEFSGTVALTDQGTPLYYCPARLRSTDNADQNNLGIFFNYTEDGSDTLRGILIFGPADEKIVVEIQGLFYSDTLSVDLDESYWTLNWPETLIKAALYQLAIFQKDATDIKDWLGSIYADLEGIDKDVIDETIAEINQIRG